MDESNLLKVIYRYVFPIFFPVGNLGQILNMFVFTRTCFRANPCAFYFLLSSVCNCIWIAIYGPLKILQYGFQIDSCNSSILFCKLSFYFEEILSLGTPWFLTLACFDRYCSSSSKPTLRRLSTMRKIRLFACVFLLLNFIFNLHIIFLYQTNDYFLQILRLLAHLISPLFFIYLLSLLIYKNRQQIRRHISPFMIDIVHNHPIIQRNRFVDHQIYLMLFFQCLIYFLLNILSFIRTSVSFLSLIASCLTSLVFFLSSSLYRQQLFIN